MAAANPFGVGLRNLHRHYDEYKGVRDLTTAKIAHNMFLELAAAIGIPGALCFLGWLTATLIALNRMRRELLARKAAPEAAVVVFLLAILAAMTFQGLVQTNFYQGKFFWLFMGLATAALRMSRQSVCEAASEISLATSAGAQGQVSVAARDKRWR